MNRLRRFWASLRFRMLAFFAAIALVTFSYTGLSVWQAAQSELPRSRYEDLAAAQIAMQQEIESLLAALPLDQAARQVTANSDGALEFSVYDQAGRLLMTSGPHLAGLRDVTLALTGSEAEAIGYDAERGQRYLAHTLPLRRGDVVAGALQVLVSLRDVDRLLEILQPRLFLGVAVSLATIFFAAVFISHNVTRTISEVTQAARAIRLGDFESRIAVRSQDEVGQLAGTINEMAAELGQLAQARANFLSKVSHELRTPLTIIKGFAVTLLRSSENPEQQRYTKIIEQQADQLTMLVDDLLELSRLDTGRFEPRPRGLQLGELVEMAVDSQLPRAETQGVQLSYQEQCRAEDAVVRIDPQRTRQIVDNLLDNALKHTPPAGRITVQVGSQDGCVNLTVADTGAGIPAGALPHIFERFFQADPTKPGAGLGLVVVKELAEAQGGQVAVQSTLGEGSTFTVSFPAYAGADGEAGGVVTVEP